MLNPPILVARDSMLVDDALQRASNSADERSQGALTVQEDLTLVIRTVTPQHMELEDSKPHLPVCAVDDAPVLAWILVERTPRAVCAAQHLHGSIRQSTKAV